MEKWVSSNFTCSPSWKEWSTGCYKDFFFLKNIAVKGISKWEKNRNEKLLNLTFLLLLRDEFAYMWRADPNWNSL